MDFFIGQVMTISSEAKLEEVKFVKKPTGVPMVTEPIFRFPDGDRLEEIPFSYVVEYLEESA